MFSEQNNAASSSGVAKGMKEFLETNSLVARFAFIMLVLLVFIILLRFGIWALMTVTTIKQGHRLLIDGMLPGDNQAIIDQDPGIKGSETIYRSRNQRGGIEFTWALWIFLNQIKPRTSYAHIFSKGNGDEYARGQSNGGNGMMSPLNAPGLYLTPNKNEIVILMNTFDKIQEEVIIKDIPVNKWVCIIIRVKDKTMDVFINGIVTKTVTFRTPPRQNYEDVRVHASAGGEGFPGYTSNLEYWNYALGTGAINSIVAKGPNTKLAAQNGLNSKDPYLSSKWYFAGQGDMFNPLGSGKLSA